MNRLTIIVIYSYQGVRRSKSAWESFPYLGLACVGIGSAAFHGTVKLQAQWCEEL